jgi:ubiquinol-cytochrome c reductase cytochrome b subunit
VLRGSHHHLKNILAVFKQKKSGFSFALVAWWSFHIARLTGAILSFHYRPWGDVFTSVSRLTGLLPYGAYLRTLHYLSGQCFLIFTLAHVLECFWNDRFSATPSRAWPRLVFLIFMAFGLTLTGFILKGDKEGIFAARIMYHLIQEIPLIGLGLSKLFLRPGEDLFLLPFVYHVIILPFIVLLLLAQHRRRIFPKGELFWGILAILSFMALVYPMPPDIPPSMASVTPTGPWFFLGTQLLLRYIPPFWAGIALPLVPLVLLAALPYISSTRAGWMRKATAASWGAHGMLLLLAWWIIPRFG